ncbi:tetratricopeptide repeat protein [Stackebrandtia endophytica]|uniref:Tetratricopeptide repeat protein n=1 Tax=Stackebrandtia endophytica TaxID=1496996 RepID=A0A543B3X5_9ACTN|nr:tetratricopeptide repeat protein [Stackebrandtia endophytica]TQL79493.1 tetratricopeptide repeat protein [Stackebrandtia endophytica]
MDTATCYERGVDFFDAKDYISAAQWLEQVVSDAPDHMAARMLLARSYYHSAQLGKAEAQLRNVLEQNPAEAYAHLMLGRTLQRQSRPDEATAHMRLAAAMTGGSLDG